MPSPALRKPGHPTINGTSQKTRMMATAPEIMRKPSSLISWIQSAPGGGRSAGEGRQDSINADTRMPGLLGHRWPPSTAWRGLVKGKAGHSAAAGMVAPKLAPVPLRRAKNRGYAETEKDRTPNEAPTAPGEECAQERQGSEQNKVARLGVHSHLRIERRGSRSARRDRVAPEVVS
jgi:hypothetical protein